MCILCVAMLSQQGYRIVAAAFLTMRVAISCSCPGKLATDDAEATGGSIKCKRCVRVP